MNKIISLATGGIMTLAIAVVPVAAFAQTTTNGTTMMPTLYNSSGSSVNASNTSALPAGYYYLSPSAQMDSRVYYYGNGTYYDANSGTYGGSVNNPNGTAGYDLGQAQSQMQTQTTVPSVPNTGAGGDSALTWLTLIVAGLVAIAGTMYLVGEGKRSAYNS